MSLHFVKVAVGLRVQAPAPLLERHLAVEPRSIGTRLAEQVDSFVREVRLGYYPALDYFGDKEQVDGALIDAARHVGGLVGDLISNDTRRRLRAVFSQVELASLQCVAFTLPSARPRAANALQALARHYTPDTVKLTLVVTSIERSASAEGVDRLAELKVRRWLERRFEALEITSAQVL